MDFIATIPIWLLALMIVLARIGDVSIGTVRTVAIVKGRMTLAVVLGFFEVLLWIVVVSQVIARVSESWLLIIAYATGFALGNGLGMLIERKLALGTLVLRMISHNAGSQIADVLRSDGYGVTTFEGTGYQGPVTLVYVVCQRKTAPDVIRRVQALDPNVFWVSEAAQDTYRALMPRERPRLGPAHWRSVVKKK